MVGLSLSQIGAKPPSLSPPPLPRPFPQPQRRPPGRVEGMGRGLPAELWVRANFEASPTRLTRLRPALSETPSPGRPR
jgi:hypothetical protein